MVKAKLTKAEHDKIRKENLAKGRAKKLELLKAKKQAPEKKADQYECEEDSFTYEYSYDESEEQSEDSIPPTPAPKATRGRGMAKKEVAFEPPPLVPPTLTMSSKESELSEIKALLLGITKQKASKAKAKPKKSRARTSRKTIVNITNPTHHPPPAQPKGNDFLKTQTFLKF